MQSHINIKSEQDYESYIIDLLKNEGYKYISSKEMLYFRKNFGDTLIIEELEKAINNINIKIENKYVYEIIKQVKNVFNINNLFEANKKAHDLIVHGVKIKNDELNKTVTYRIFDFNKVNNNIYSFTNQYNVYSNNPAISGDKQRLDIVVFVNGLPIVIFELKSPENIQEETLISAFQQIKKYQEHCVNLFQFNFINIISNSFFTKIGTITSGFENYFYWRKGLNDKKSNSNDLPPKIDELIKSFFKKQNLSLIIKDYTFFTDKHKIVASYHQFFGIEKAASNSINKINEAKNKSVYKKGGIIWHTQGSGKSFSMIFLTKKIINTLPKTTFVFISDRNDLDDQLYKTFKSAEKFLNQEPFQIPSVKELSENLKDKKQNGIFFSTIQKFKGKSKLTYSSEKINTNHIQEEMEILSTRDDIIVIADEAHRSHRDIFDCEDDNTFLTLDKISNASKLRNAFPNATFIGFTGTPIMNNDGESTTDVFGEYISIYSMLDATRDKFVVPINYEPSKLEMTLKKEELDLADKYYEELQINVIQKGVNKKIFNQKIKNKIIQIEHFLENDSRINKITDHFLNHYKIRCEQGYEKAMIVCQNRKIAFKYWKQIIDKKPDWKKKVKLILSIDANKDSKELINAMGNPSEVKTNIKKFKTGEIVNIVIVVDKLLTGFDVPSLGVIYVDKIMKMHNLMQAIARVNRTNPNKEAGLVVDYIGIYENIKEALNHYTQSHEKIEKNKLEFEDVDLIKISIVIGLENIYKKLFQIPNFKVLNPNEAFEERKLINTTDKIIDELFKDNKENELLNYTYKIKKYYQVIRSKLSKEENKYFQILFYIHKRISSLLYKNINVNKEENEIIKMIQNATVYENLNNDNKIISFEEIHKYVVEEMKEVDKHFKEIKKRDIFNSLEQMIEEADKISEHKKQILSEDLKKLLKRFEAKHLSYDELMKELSLFSNKIIEMNENKNIDLSNEEYIFYQIISDYNSDTNKYSLNKVKNITKEIVSAIQKKWNKNWRTSEETQRKIRVTILDILYKHDFPPEPNEKTADNLCKEIDNLFWSRDPNIFNNNG